MPIALSWAPLHAEVHVVRCCGCANHRERRRHAIPIALAASHCPTARDFVPWCFLVAGPFSACQSRHPADQKPAQILTWPDRRPLCHCSGWGGRNVLKSCSSGFCPRSNPDGANPGGIQSRAETKFQERSRASQRCPKGAFVVALR
jgi:hypothetical protein